MHFVSNRHIATGGKHLAADTKSASPVIWQEAVIGADKYADVEQNKHELKNTWRTRECEKAAVWVMAWGNSEQKPSAEWETRRRWAARMGVWREREWRYFTSITVQFILLKLFFKETQKKFITGEIVCNASPLTAGVASPISLTLLCWRAIFELWITSHISFWHYFTFHLYDAVLEETPASKKTNFKHNINTNNIKWSTNCIWDKKSQEIYRKT